MTRRPGPLRFRKAPYAHQMREFRAYRTAKARARFWTMRTGKSKASIDEAAYLYHMGFITAVIIIAPNTVHQNWILKEFPEHCPRQVPYQALIYKAARAKQKGVMQTFQELCLDRSNLKVLSMPSTAMRTETAKSYLLTFIKRHGGKVLVIYDEAHDFKKPGSKRTVVARGVSKLCEYKRLLTGTPAHNSPMHLYSQFELLEEGALGFTSFEKFKAHYGLWEVTKTRAGRPFIKFLGPQNEGELTSRLEKFTSIVRREDVPELQKPLFVERVFELTDRQRKIYDTLFENPVLDEEVLDGGVFFQKLQQIASGFLITKSEGLKEIVAPGENPRFDLIFHEIMNSPGKIIVWGHYHYEFQAWAALAKEHGIDFCEIHGLAPTTNHIQTAYDFRSSEYQKVAFAHPKSGGQGLPLDFVDTIVWGSQTFDNIYYDQASERGTEIGKRAVDVLDIIAKDTVDEYIYDARGRKINVAELIAGNGLVELKRLLSEPISDPNTLPQTAVPRLHRAGKPDGIARPDEDEFQL